MYLIFAGQVYYPEGGILDLVHELETIQECKDYVESLNEDDFQWAQIVDKLTFEMVLDGFVCESYTNNQYWKWNEKEERL